AIGETVTHTYGPAGEGNCGDYNVTLTVTDDDGESHEEISVQEQTVRVNAYPRADFDVVTDPPVRNEPVEFDAGNSFDPDGNIDKYAWDFGDGNTATTTDPVTEHTFTTGGKQTVTLRVTDNDGASHDDFSVHEETFTVYIRVAISIQPNGTGKNSINPNRKGEIPAAVLHTSAFDPPARLDHSTVHFGDPDDVGFDTSTDPFTPEGGATPAHDGGHVEDVDDDSDDDSLFHFPTRDADFESDDTEGELVGLTNDDVPVFGTDSINTVGGGGP
ncbi:MAG: PKD domain-containing protein, partial [Halovenus sp.]